MSRQIHFFATQADLLQILETFEAKVEVKYCRFGHFASNQPYIYSSGKELPELGKATCESAIGCETHLVSLKPSSITPRYIETQEKFAFDQLNNPDTITFLGGGFWKPNILLYGKAGAAHKTPDSELLMNKFTSAVKKHTKKVKAFWVGSEAMKFLDSGCRLTIAAQSPTEFDLKK